MLNKNVREYIEEHMQDCLNHSIWSCLWIYIRECVRDRIEEIIEYVEWSRVYPHKQSRVYPNIYPNT